MRGDNLNSLSALDGQGSDSVMCMVTDIENSQKNTLTVPFATSARSLLEEVALQFGYASGSFDLRYTDAQGLQHFLNDLGEQPLADVCSSWAKKSKKNQFFVLHVRNGDLTSSNVQPNAAAAAFHPLPEASSSTDPNDSLTHNGTVYTNDVTTEESSAGVEDAVDSVRTLYPEASDNQVNVNVDGYNDVPLGPVACRGQPPDYNSAVYSSRYGEGSYNPLPKSDTGFVGLVNQAMTCYLNSLLQTLFMTPEFRNTLYSWEFDYKDDETRSIPFQLQKLFLTLQTSNKRAVETTAVTKSFGWDSSEVWQQHDVQELCHVMFDALEEKWKGTTHSDVINSLYRGRMKDYVKCLECHNESARSVIYLDICLAIKPFGSSRAFESVEEALHAFVEPETLQGNDQYFCEKCNRKCDAHKGLKFITFPYLLTLQLKRFDFDASTYQRIKLNDRMTFSELLDLSSFVQPEVAEIADSCTARGGGMPTSAGTPAGDAEHGGCHRTDPEVTESSVEFQSSVQSSVAAVAAPTPDGTADRAATAPAEAPTSAEAQQPCCASSIVDSSLAAADVVCPAAAPAQLSPGPALCKSDSSSCRAADDEGIDVSCSSSSLSLRGDSSSEAHSEQSFGQGRQDDVTRAEDPWTYELFSVMVHSGNALGGHYYAYIKSFDDNQFYSFNDQMVTKVTLDDVMRSCGGTTYGGTRTSYSAANAYMLMYRRVDRKRNASFSTDSLPRHIEELLQQMRDTDERDERQREVSRNTCRLRLFCHLPPSGGATTDPPADDSSRRSSPHGGVDACSAMPASTDSFVTCHRSATMRRTFTESTKGKLRAEFKLDVHRDKSLLEATDAAYELSGLSKLGVPRDCVRLVQYDELMDTIEKSYDGQDRVCVATLFGGVKSTYHFSLLLETKKPSLSFPTFISGGLTLKVYIVDKKESCLRPAINVPATLSTTVKELYSSVAKCVSECFMVANVNVQMLAVHNESIIHCFLNEESTLQDEGFCKGSLVFVEEMPVATAPGSGAEVDRSLLEAAHLSTRESRLYSIVETLISTVTLEIGLPGEQALLASLARERRHEALRCQDSEVSQQHEAEPIAAVVAAAALPGTEASAGERLPSAGATATPACASVSGEGAGGVSESVAATPASFQAHSCCGGAEPICTSWHRHVEISQKIAEGIQDRVAVVHADKRLTVAELKRVLERFVGAPPGQLRLFRVFSSGQEMECQARPSEKLSSICDDLVLVAKVGRAPAKGETRVKVFRLDLTGRTETTKGQLEVVVPHGMPVRTLQVIVADEINMAEPGSSFYVGSSSGREPEHKLPVSADRCRLRKKSFMNPGLVLHASHKLGVDVQLFNNYELFVELLDEADTHRGKPDMAVFIQHWLPSKCDLGPMQSVVLPADADLKDIVAKISTISGIPMGRISVGKARGSFPGTADVALVDIHTRTSWQPCLAADVTGGSGDGEEGACGRGGGGGGDSAADDARSSFRSALYVDDGCVLLYRDEQEKMLELTNEKRREIQQKDEGRGVARSSTRYGKQKEKPLKIYTNSSSSLSSKAASDADSPTAATSEP